MGIIGHQKIIKLLDRSIAKNSVSHAYIFSGPTGVGKFTVALDFSEKLLKDPSIRSGLGRINSDLMIIEPEAEEKKGIVKKRDIKIGKIREFQHWAGLTAAGGKYKVAIINDADRLNKAAQNALLKNLEEPPTGVIIILIVQNEKKILPTISSRCQRIKFNPVTEAELEKNIPVEGKNKEDILFWSLGRPGLMLELSKNKEELAVREESLRELKNLLEGSINEKFFLAEKLSKDGNLAAKNLNLWLIMIRESFLDKAQWVNSHTKGSHAQVLGKQQEYFGVGVKISKNKALELAGKIGESLELLKDTNSNTRLALENLFLNF